MTFIPGNLAVAVDTIGGGSLRIHAYRPDPVDDDVYAAGYFEDAALLGMRIGDMVVIIRPTGAEGASVNDVTGNNATIIQDIGVSGAGFDVTVTPTVTSGAYVSGDIMGGLMVFAVAAVADRPFIISGVQITMKAAVTPNLTVVLFNADPSATVKTDNAAYSLAVADVPKVITALPLQALGAAWVSHGTPKTIELDNLGIVASPSDAGLNVYALMIDGTGVTLTSTSDVQVRLRGASA